MSFPSPVSTNPKFTILHAPSRSPLPAQPSIILCGSIQTSSPSNPSWQTVLSNALSDLPISILDPVRPDWDASWVEDVSYPPFKEQVEWEMDYAGIADVVVVNFVPGTPAPVSLLELGLCVGLRYGGQEATGAIGDGKGRSVLVCCPQGFYKRGNVEMVCRRFGVRMVESLEDLVGVARGVLEERLRAAEGK